MCGIFGLVVNKSIVYNSTLLYKTLNNIALISESRGKDSSGVAFKNLEKNKISVVKGDIPIQLLLKSKEFDSNMKESLESYKDGSSLQVLGHARLVTNGSQLHEENNQPVIKDDMVLVHNGIVVNADELWEQNSDLKREYMIDTEILPAMIRKGLRNGEDIISASDKAFQSIIGTFSVAIMFADRDEFLLSTNNGSLHYITDDKSFFVFASEDFYLKELTEIFFYKKFPIDVHIRQLRAGSSLLLNTITLKHKVHLIGNANGTIFTESYPSFNITKQNIENKDYRNEVVIDPSIFIVNKGERNFINSLEYNIEEIRNLKRCTKCLLPSNFPFIEFDYRGECNYCRNHKQSIPKGIDELIELIKPYRRKDGKPDCIVPFSGGRDSTYSLHYVKKELGLNPIAFTYDWGMLTDLGRRNTARVCGKLGVENIIVAADIRKKRKNIRNNVIAWLKKPCLGMVPLFMAGDKYFFHYSNKIQSENNIDISIWGSNPLENTDFKSGFTGVSPNFNKKRIDELKLINKLKLTSFFVKNYITNPSYINSSLFDTIGSFNSRYLTKRHGYIQLFDYKQWDEQELESLIINEYDWEKSIDTNSTWRIGDGTAAFYNYIYLTVAGFSEFDTFRSNQIREGQLTRDEGLKLILEENAPRYENLRWYLALIDLDFRSTIEQINRIPKLYNV